MHRFKVWAPLPERVSVRIGDIVRPLKGPDDHDCWHLDVEEAKAGSDYGFVLDDVSETIPDPRSSWQPNGVHGLSRIYDHSAFSWADTKFHPPPLASAVVYEMHVGTFTPEGTLDAAVERLDFLVELGITHVELMPVAAFDGHFGWGYDGVALYAVHEPYGGPDALKRFVNAAHGKGLAVLLDVVYNHFGPSGNYAGKFGPYVVDTHHTPWGGAVNLEGTGAHEVRRFFCDNALMWLRDFHIDGLRLDAIHALIDRSAIHFLEQLAVEVETLEAVLGRRLVLIAESDLNDPRVVRPIEAGGLGMSAQWSDDFHHALLTVLLPEERRGYLADFGSLAQLAKAIERTFVYDGIYSVQRGRNHGKAPAGLSQHRFVSFIQNHDQVGNRATGDRLSHFAGADTAKIAAALVLTGPFVPMLFQGDEWAAGTPFQYFANHQDPALARAVSEGRRREFSVFGDDGVVIPDPEKPSTFEASKLNWEELNLPERADMLGWYRALIKLRRRTPDLNDGTRGHAQASYDEDAKWFSMTRGNIRVVCNLATKEQQFPIATGSEVLLSSRPVIAHKGDAIVMAPRSTAVIAEPV